MTKIEPQPIPGCDVRGEVRTLVRLTNPLDQFLNQEGQVPDVEVRSMAFEAAIDPGAVFTVIPRSVMSALGLLSRGTRSICDADGRVDVVEISGPLAIDINDDDTVDEVLIRGDCVRIGLTVLNKLDLQVDFGNHRLIPNPKHPNGPVTRV